MLGVKAIEELGLGLQIRSWAIERVSILYVGDLKSLQHYLVATKWLKYIAFFKSNCFSDTHPEDSAIFLCNVKYYQQILIRWLFWWMMH